MAYIVDLFAILEGVFVLTQDGSQGCRPVTREIINLAVQAYTDSENKIGAHDAIKEFVGTHPNIFDPGHKDEVLDKVERLIRAWRWEPGAELKSQANELYASTRST